jgi:hypothetical protein
VPWGESTSSRDAVACSCRCADDPVLTGSATHLLAIRDPATCVPN